MQDDADIKDARGPDLSRIWQSIRTRTPVATQAEIERLRNALQGLLDHYVQLVVCGDCGNWDAEKEPQVIAARAALTVQP